MMELFTAGPWSQGKRGPNGCPIIGNGRGLMVAMLAHSANELGQEVEAEANAKLIAQAPDMHAALNRIAFRCQSFLADERTMQLESIEAILAICDAALDNSSPENS